jgi:site-specific DNA-methyltransferase (adenine-specific)
MTTRHPVIIGDATLYLGDCMDILPTMDKVDAVITDPPYGEQTQLNARTHRNKGFNDAARSHYIDFVITNDEVRSVFVSAAFLVCRWVVASMEFRHAADFERNPPDGLRFIRIGAWVKSNGAPQFTGDRPAQGWEAIAIMHKDGEKLHWNGGGSRAVWTTDVERNNGHPTPKPLPLIREWVSLFSDIGETILDPFMGSGTTGVAAIQLGRKFIGIEREPKYFDIACQRIEQAAAQGQLFEPAPVKQHQETFL